MRILVTGASGFSGGFVAADLAGRGHEVLGLYRHDTVFLERLRHAASSVHLARCALADVAQIAGPFDAVVHAAATSPAPSIKDADFIRDNREGTAALIEATRGWQCRSFVYFSSLSIYGEITHPVVDETTPRVHPDTYGVTKYDSEHCLAAIADRMPGLALRLPGIIGWGARRNWLSGVAADLLARKPIRAFHLDAAFNNAAHIADIATLVAQCVERGWNGFDAVVLGASGSITVRTAIERLAAGLDVPSHVEEIPAPKASFTLSSRRAVERWGYAPMEIGAMIDRYTRELRTAPAAV